MTRTFSIQSKSVLNPIYSFFLVRLIFGRYRRTVDPRCRELESHGAKGEDDQGQSCNQVCCPTGDQPEERGHGPVEPTDYCH